MKIPAISKKVKIIFLSIVGILLTYSLCGFIVLPAILSDQIPKLTQQHLNRNTQIENIDFNPFSMELSIQGIKVNNLDDSSFFNSKQLYANVSVLQSIANFNLGIDKILIDQPSLTIKRDKQGGFNFSDLLNSPPDESENKSTDDDLFPVEITQTVIANGKLSWEDNYYSKSQHEDIYPLNLNIGNFTTLVGKQSQLGFSLQLSSGGQFEWNGDLELTPLRSSGKIKLDKVEFRRIWELFLQDSVNFELLKGSELIEANYQLSDTKDGLQLLINNAHIDIYELKLSEKGKQENESLISVPDFKISGISLNLLKKEIEINNISAKDAAFKAWLNNDGSINFQSLFSTQTEAGQSKPQNQAPNKDNDNPWHIKLNQLALNNFSLQFDDKTLGDKPAHLSVTSLNLETTDLTNNLDKKIPFKLDLKVNDSGILNVKGQATPQPFSTDLLLTAKNISIKNFQPYISKFIRLDIISGLFNTNINVSLLQPANNDLKISLKGDSHINNFVSRDQISNKDFLNWKQLSLNKINIDLAENRFLIDTVKIDQPYSRVLIRKNKTINLNDIVVNAPKEKQATKPKKVSKKQESKSYFKIGHIEMTEGKSDFSDLSLILPFSAHINRLKGSVKGVSSEKNAVAKITLNGRIGKLAPVNIKGKINPHNGNSEFSLDFKNMSLPLMTPYMADFAGRKIEKGKMSLGLKYKIQNKQLTASNSLLIDQLVLGEEVKNPDATSLPLDLAIALMQDVDGKIALDMPITGSLDDPEFSVAGLVVKALINVITKIVTSPFSAIASLIEGDEDPSKIMFLAGQSTLEDKQKIKLEGIVKALSSRPALNLEIKGAAFSQHDWPHMQDQAIDQLILQSRADELNKNQQKNVLAENLTYSEKEYKRVLAELFIKKHPELAERSLFGTPRLIDSESGDFYEVAKAKLAKAIKPDSKLLHKLAISRSQTIAKHLADLGIPLERIFLLDADVDPESVNNEIATTLSLTVD